MRRARFSVDLPSETWIGEVSRTHPAARFRLLAGMETDEGAIELGEVQGEDPHRAAEAVREHPTVDDYEQIHLDNNRGLARYRVQDVSLYRFLRASGIPPEFPVEVEDGRFELEITADRGRIAEVDAGLRASPLDHELVFLVEHEGPGSLLTDRQREALGTALRMGYFEVPRKVRLADVAAELGVDTSTASGVLRRGEARVLRSFLAGPLVGPDDR